MQGSLHLLSQASTSVLGLYLLLLSGPPPNHSFTLHLYAAIQSSSAGLRDVGMPQASGVLGFAQTASHIDVCLWLLFVLPSSPL